MKRKILASILGAAAMVAATSSYGQGIVNLNNYASTGNLIVYGSGASKVPGTTAGAGVVNGVNGTAGTINWTIGIYYALGDVTASVAADATGTKDPATLGGSLGFASGVPSDTTSFNAAFGPGYFSTTSGDAVINGWTAGSVTFEVVAYSGANYNASAYRGHSTAFLMTPVAAGGQTTAPFISTKNGGMPSFGVFAVPEPSTFALAGIGAAALLAFRRKKQA